MSKAMINRKNQAQKGTVLTSVKARDSGNPAASANCLALVDPSTLNAIPAEQAKMSGHGDINPR